MTHGPQPSGVLSRRGVLAAALALAACDGKAEKAAVASAAPLRGPAPALCQIAPFPVGCAVTAQQLDDPQFVSLLTRHFNQLTVSWEMKMEYILLPDGTLRWDAPDRIAAFAKQNAMRLFGHTLIWYAQESVAFAALDGHKALFAQAYRNYILAVAGRYRGQTVAWDVVNEPVAEDGNGLRTSRWSTNLGEIDHIRRAFDHAREADPAALLLINDYNLETLPKKRATFLNLVERLLKLDVPIQAIGNQSHVGADMTPGQARAAMAELSSLGLPIHLSELDVSINQARRPLRSDEQLVAMQAATTKEIAQAYCDLPAAQRFGFTVFGLRNGDSWLRSQKENPDAPWDEPLLFDDRGEARPMFWALVDSFKAARRI
jgi:endo-1,4-beta-xylanase